jgi:hypothetical protein
MLVFRNRAAHFFLLLLSLTAFSASPAPGQKSEVLWKKHVVFSNTFTFTATAADFDDNGVVNITDVIGVLDYLINSGTAPAAPFPGPGVDPTEDSRECR